MNSGINNTKNIKDKGKGNVGDDYFRLIHFRKSNLYLNDFLCQFNPDDYWILKATRNFKFVSVDEMKEFKYAGYMFYKKTIYEKKFIEEWLYLIYKDVMFLSNPFPPQYIKKLIKIIDEM